MLERVRISEDTAEGHVRISQEDETGITVGVAIIPLQEWEQLKSSMISSGKLNGDFSSALTHLVALWVLLEES